MPRKRNPNRNLTIFELMVVLLVAAIAFSAATLGIWSALKSEGFDQSVDTLTEKILLCQQIELASNVEVILELKEGQKGITTYIYSSEQVPERILKLANSKGHLKGIEYIVFDGKREATCYLKFSPTLGASSKGELLLCGSKKKRLYLPGYEVAYTSQLKQGVDHEIPPPFPKSAAPLCFN